MRNSEELRPTAAKIDDFDAYDNGNPDTEAAPRSKSLTDALEAEGLSLYEKKCVLINREIDSMGMGKYQWYAWGLCGFGYMLDLLWAQAFGLVLSPLQQELGFGRKNLLSSGKFAKREWMVSDLLDLHSIHAPVERCYKLHKISHSHVVIILFCSRVLLRPRISNHESEMLTLPSWRIRQHLHSFLRRFDSRYRNISSPRDSRALTLM